jgi:hypothetical protein
MIRDACALLFRPSGDPRLTASARERLTSEPTVYYCAIRAFEIALRVSYGCVFAASCSKKFWMGVSLM